MEAYVDPQFAAAFGEAQAPSRSQISGRSSNGQITFNSESSGGATGSDSQFDFNDMGKSPSFGNEVVGGANRTAADFPSGGGGGTFASTNTTASFAAGFNNLPMPGSSAAPTVPRVIGGKQEQVSGIIMSRTSMRTILMKKWKETSFWVRHNPTRLLLFRSHDDYQDWLQNPYYSQKERDYLVKLKIDFAGDILAPNVRGFNVTEVKAKTYGKGTNLFQFKVEKIMDYGPNIVGAFASERGEEAEAMRDVIAGMILEGRREVGAGVGVGAASVGGVSLSPSALSPGRAKQGDFNAFNSGGGSYNSGGGGVPSGRFGSFNSPPQPPALQPRPVAGRGTKPGDKESPAAYNFEALTLE